jgi:hypothetical protein
VAEFDCICQQIIREAETVPGAVEHPRDAQTVAAGGETEALSNYQK